MVNTEKSVQDGSAQLHLHEFPSTKPDEIDPRLEKRILRKIDRRLLPILGLLYTICLIDRSNISVARIAGLDEDLRLDVGSRASIVLLIFFIGYILVEIPSNMVLKRVGPANWLAGIVVAWGAVSIGIGFLTSWAQLAVLRALLGIFEGGFFPGCVFLVSCWYVRYEVQKRMAFFYLLAQGLSGFGSILAYGIIQIAKHTTYKGWRWIYIVEGAITCIAGVAAWFIVVDFPDSRRNHFLTADEKWIVKERLRRDPAAGSSAPIDRHVIWATMKDWRVWSYTFMYMSGAIVSYALVYFLPIILQQSLGFTQQLTFLLNAPPLIFAALECFLISWLADKWQTRAPFVIFQGIIGIVGLAMTGFIQSPWPRYAGAFLGTAGANGVIITTLAWQTNNVIGNGSKAVASAMLIMGSGVGGIYSSLVFRQQDAPAYVPGIIASMAVLVVTVGLAAATAFFLRLNNRRADRGSLIVKGNKDFRYTI